MFCIKSVRLFRLVEVFYYLVLGIVIYYSLDGADFSKMTVVNVYNASSGKVNIVHVA